MDDILGIFEKAKAELASEPVGAFSGSASSNSNSSVATTRSAAKYDAREQAVIDRNMEGAVDDISRIFGMAKGEMEVDFRRQQRAYAEQAPPEVAEPVKEMLGNLGNRRYVLEVLRKMTPEQREEALRLAPGLAQQMGDDRGGVIGRTLGAIGRGISHGVSQPLMELAGIGGTDEEIEYIRQLDAAASQEYTPTRPGDPWYERGPLQATEMVPWMATVVGGGGAGRALATGIAGRALGAGGRAVGVAGKAGELAGITAASFPGQYAQEVDQLKEMGMEDGVNLRLLAGGTAAVSGLIEGIVPNPFRAKDVSLTDGALKAARQYLWEAAKRAPGEMSEEYLQGVTSGLGKHVAQYLDANAEDRSIADAFDNGWEQAKEAALPMAFLLGTPAVGGAGLSAIRARRMQLEQMRSKGFVTREDGKKVGIEGTRREIAAKLDAEIESLKAQELEAEQASQTTVPVPEQQQVQTEPQVEQPVEASVPNDDEIARRMQELARMRSAGAHTASDPAPTQQAAPQASVAASAPEGTFSAYANAWKQNEAAQSQVPVTPLTEPEMFGLRYEIDQAANSAISAGNILMPTSGNGVLDELKIQEIGKSIQAKGYQVGEPVRQDVDGIEHIGFDMVTSGQPSPPPIATQAPPVSAEAPPIAPQAPTFVSDLVGAEVTPTPVFASDLVQPETVAPPEPPMRPAQPKAGRKPKDTAVGPARAMEPTEEGRPADGKPVMPGDRFLTNTGRETTPYPSYDSATERKATAGEKKSQQWIIENAIAEAESRGDDFNATQFRAELETAKKGKLPQASKDAATLYVFGDYIPKVPKRFATDLVPKPSDAVSVGSQGEEVNDVRGTKKGGDPNEVQAKEGRQEQANAEAEAQGQVARQGEQAAESPSPAFSPTEQYTKLPEKSREKFESAWEGSDPQAMKTLVHSGNKVLRAEFENRTGEKLPRTVKGTDEVVDRVYQGRDSEAKQKRDDKLRERLKTLGYDDLRTLNKEGAVKVGSEVIGDPSGLALDELNRRLDEAGAVTRQRIVDAVNANGGYENNSADDVESIRRKLYDGANTPSHAEIRVVMQDMKNEAGNKTPTKASDNKPKPPEGYKPLEEFTPMVTQTLSPDLELEENRQGIKELALKQGEAVGYRVYPKRGSTKGGYWQYGTVRNEPSGSHASIELVDGTVESVGGSRLIRLEKETKSPFPTDMSQWLREKGMNGTESGSDAKSKSRDKQSAFMDEMDKQEDANDFIKELLGSKLGDVSPEKAWRLYLSNTGAATGRTPMSKLISEDKFKDAYGLFLSARTKRQSEDNKPSDSENISVEEFADIFANPDQPAAKPRKSQGRKASSESRPEKSQEARKPKSVKKDRTKGIEDGLKEAREGADLILKGLRDLGNTGLAGVPINADIARGMGMLANGLIKAGRYKFAEFIDSAVEMIGAPAVRYLGPYLEAGWNKKAETDSRLDKAGSVNDYLDGKVESVGGDYGTPEIPNRIALGKHFYSKLKNGESYARITDARKEASELIGGQPSNASAVKDIDEAVEIGVVLAARDIAQSGGSDESIYSNLIDLYERQPNLSNRTSTSMAEQAYSTPAPLAFAINRRAGVTPNDTVYDSSAGNGMLLIVGGTRYANELNADRAESLRGQGIETTNEDATSFTLGKPIDALVINPPFGLVNDESGKPKQWVIDGVRTDKVDHAITLQSMKEIPENGKVAIIIGAKGFEKSEPKDNSRRGAAYLAEKRFYDAMYDNYNVVDHFTVHGDLYRRQGASFPVDVIIIDGKGKSQRPKPYNIVGGGIPEMFRTWEDLKDAKLRPVSSVSSTSAGRDEATDSTPMDSGNEATVEGDAEKQSSRTAGARVGGQDGRKPDSERLGGTDEQPRASNAADAKGIMDGQANRPEGGGRDSGRRDAGRSGRSDSRVGVKPDETAETDHQVAYSPGSGNKSVDTLIPRNHQAAVAKSLDAVAEIYGDIDKFVASELGYDIDEFREVFSAEQVDALALAIARHKDGGAFIIGDQTGVGKGRAAAAMMVYANKNGMVPVFITEKPTLYADMVRDLIDIKQSTDESPFNILMTNAISGKDAIPLPDGRVLSQSANVASDNLERAVENVLNGNSLSVERKPKRSGKKKTSTAPVVYNAIFTTYSQMRPKKQNTPERALQLKRISNKSFFILDESHNAGGKGDGDQDQQSGQDATITSASIVRDLISDAAGVYFSSATYAKRPQTMGLYARTGMTAATNGDPNALAESIANGGVPLQQVVSEQLVESGMYLRRERSFDGVEFNPKTIEVDLSNLDNVASIFSAINFFDGYAQEAIKDLSDEITSSGGSIAETEATGQAGLESTSFASILHNLVDQMLLAVKADAVANETIESIKNGEAPVIYVDSTLEAALERHVEEIGASQGDEIDFSYKDLVRRYLDRSREYTTRTDADDPDSIVRIRLTDAQLGPAGVAAYNRALEMIENFDGNMPASPIDYIRKRVNDAGYSISEITGRKITLEYGEDGKLRLGKRQSSEEGSGGRTKTVSKFNNGDLDAVLINQSGATGISMHASENFVNQKPRHMIIGQPARNIDTFMQSLGRVHRTGQVVLPRFTLLMTSAPAEIRPASVLMKKLSSLNANVTASAKGAVSFDAPDVINIIGDQVVAEYLADNQTLDRHLGELVQLRRDGTPRRNPGIAKKASGRMALRPVAEQKDFWDSVIASYDELVEELNRVGKNPLVASTIDLKAKTIESVTIFDGDEGSSNLFMHPASVETVIANKPGKPMTADEVVAAVSNFYGKPASRSVVAEWIESTRGEIQDAYQDYVRTITSDLAGDDLQQAIAVFTDTGNRQMANLMEKISSFAPGNSVSVHERAADGSLLEVIPGYVTRVKRLKGGNPLSASKWVADIAIASPDRVAKTALSRTGEQDPDVASRGGTYLEFRPNDELFNAVGLKEFEESDLSVTETRYIGVGNILAAYSQLGKAGGQITFFTDSNGEIRRGVLMPRSFRIDRWNEARPVVLDNVDQAYQFLSQGGQLITPDRVLALMMVRGELIARAPKAKSRSGKYTINPGILRAAEPYEFGSIGSRMEMAVPDMERQKRVLSAIMSVASLQAVGTDKNLARQVKESTPSKSEQKLGDKLDDLDDTLMQTSSDSINEEMLVQSFDIAMAAKEAGIDVYDRLVAFAVKKLGEQRTREIGAYLYHAGNAAGMKGVRPTRDVLGVPGVTREQAVKLAKAAFGDTLTDEQIEAGISLQDVTAFGRDEIGFAPFGSPVPGQSLNQKTTPTQTPEFRRWFGDSKVVDKNGDPLRVYHGTAQQFTEFNQSDKTRVPSKLIGHFFSPSGEMASDHALRKSEGGLGASVYPVYLSIENPYIESVVEHMDMNVWSPSKIKKWKQSLIDDGYDGIYIKPLKSMPGYESGVWVAFDSTQIKSAIGNQGTFATDNPSILMQNQEQGDNIKGWTTFISATRAIIGATDKADVSTFIHEFFHPMRRFLLDRSVPQDRRAGITDKDIQALEDYAGVKDGEWTREAEEKAAKAWEQYWFEGKSPNSALESLFEKIARWMRGVYKSINEITGGKLPKEVRDLFDKIVQRGGGVPPGRTTGKAQPADGRGEDLTSIKNAMAEERAVMREAIHMWDAATETSQEWLDKATEMIAADPYIGQRLVRELNDKARNLSDIEVAILQIYYRHVYNQFESKSDRMFAAEDKGDTVDAAKLRVDVDAIQQELWDIEEAAHYAGREWGRSGVARKILLRKDFSLAAMLRKARVANAGKKLTKEQTAEIEKLARQVAELEGRLAKSEQERLDLERQVRAQNDINAEKKRTSGTSRKSESKKQAASKLQDFAKKFANIFGFKQSDTDTLQQTEDERMAEEAESVVQAYVESGVFSLGELMANVKRDLGSELPMQARVAFAAAWRNLKLQGDIPTPTVDANNSSSLTRLARRIQRALVEAGITDRDEVVDAVQESLQEMDIELTKRETMDALSGYGQFTPLPDDTISKVIRDINGQLQQIAKLQDMGYELVNDEWVKVRDGVAPSKTGGERRTPTDEERELIRQVNEAKRQGGYKITDPESQLRSAVDAAKRAAENRIYDLKKAIKEEKPIVGNKTSLAGKDKELDDLRKQLAEWTEKYRDLFPKPEATMEQRIAATNRVLDAEIATIRRQLLSGDVMPKGRKEPATSPEIEAKRARLEALRAERESLQLLLNPNMKNEQAAKAYMAALLKQIADYQDRLAKNNFDPKPKKSVRTLSKDELLLKKQLEEVKDNFFRKAADYRLANMSPGEKAWDYTKEASHLSRAIMTSFDLSAVFRQGGVASFSHPKLAAQVSKDMWNALWSDQAEFDIAERIRNHPLYQFAMTAKLSITEDEARITKQEEAFMGRWVRWGIGKEGSTINKLSKKALAPVAASGRAYTTFLNGMRFELFKSMVDGLGGMGQVTADEAKIIAQYVNVATGRADLGKFNQAAANMSVIFFAPRYVASRFQYLAMPFYMLPNSKISGRVRKAIAMEYARYISSVSLFLGSVVALGSILAGDDDDEAPRVELDPRSTDFLKIRIGETRIDPMAGFSQIATFTTQALYGQRKRQDGEVRDLRGENHKWGDKDTWDVVSDFVRKKLAPVPGAFINVLTGENVIGEKETILSAGAGLFVPLSLGEVQEAMQSRGIPAGTAISMLALLGMGGGTYGPRTQYANGTPEEREKQFSKDLDGMDFNSPDPEYSDFLTAEQLDQVKSRREERKQDLAYAASASPNRKDYQSDESYQKAIASRDKALEKIREAGIGPNELRMLLLAYWKRTNKSPYELKDGVLVLKKPVQDRIRQIRRELNKN